MKKYLLLLVFAFITTSIYADPVKVNIVHDGYEREYMVYLPKSYNEAKESGLIICMHGFNSSMKTFFGNYNIMDVADELNLVVVAPQALPEKDPQVIKKADDLGKLIGKPFPLDAVWGCGLRVKSNNILFPIDVELNKDIDDTGFLKAIIDEIKNEYSINQNIFLFGTSLGGFMSYQYAMYHGNELSGLISICGSMGTNIHNTNSDVRLPICDFHSVTDEVVPYSGNLNYKLIFNIKVSLCQSKSDVIDFWVDNNKLSAIPTTEPVAYHPSTNSITVQKQIYTGNQNEVIHYKIDGAYHEHYFKKENGDCMDYNEEITKFIKSHSIDDGTGIQYITKPLKIYPNPAKDIVNIGIDEGYATIYNINGQQVFSANITSSQLDVSFLSKGIYIVRIQSPEGNYQGKLIIK